MGSVNKVHRKFFMEGIFVSSLYMYFKYMDPYPNLMTYNYTIKLRIYPNNSQKNFFEINFGCIRFVYNKMIEERKGVYRLYEDEKDKLYNYKYKTEKQYKEDYPLLKEAMTFKS